MKGSIIGEKPRRIVPRWRGFSSSSDLKSQKQSAKAPSSREISQSLLENQVDWQRDPSLWNALDFIAGAIVENRLDLASKAVEQVRNDPRLPAAGASLIATAEIKLSDIDWQAAPAIEQESAKQIRASRRRLAENQWDAVEWMDLARSFTSLGETLKASRCVGAAIKIAPKNRFVTRAASRFYVHINDPDRAVWLLSHADFLGDPWIMAPLIAISSRVGRASTFAVEGLRMLKQDFSANDLTELGAALGTLEVENGKLVHAKKLLRQSLKGANENSVAQIDWVNRARLGDVIDISEVNPPRLYEAGAWKAFVSGEWEEARRLSALWFWDQPFSGNAATVYSYVLSDILSMHAEAESVLKSALRCNPGHPILINNRAFALINLDRLSEAEGLLNSLPNEGSDIATLSSEATRGLLAFRKNRPEIGRAKFHKVIDDFLSSGDENQAARAATALAFEEVRISSAFMVPAVQKSLEMTAKNKSSNILHKVKQLEYAATRVIEADRRIPQGLKPQDKGKSMRHG